MENNNDLKDLYTPISTENADNADNSEEFAIKRKKGKRLFFIIFFSVIFVVTATFITLYTMATDRTNADKFTAKTSTDIIEPLAKSLALGETAEISDGMLNSFLTYCLNSFNKENKSSSPLSIQGIAVNFHKDSPVDIYVKSSYNGLEAIVNAKADITLDEKEKEIKLTLKEIYLGNLPVEPELFVQYALSQPGIRKYTDALGDSLDISKRTVTLPSEFKTEFYEIPLQLGVTQIELTDGSAAVNTTGIIDSIAELISKLLTSE